MSSDLQSALKLLLLNNYVAVMMIVTVGYDYILTFSREVDYVWCRRWTWVSTTFIIVRSTGPFCIIATALVGSSFMPGPVTVYAFHSNINNMKEPKYKNLGTDFYIIQTFIFPVFLGGADLMMVIRVYVMWNRSRWILWVLLFLLIVQTAVSIITAAIFNNPRTYLSITLAQIGNLVYCNVEPNLPWALYVYTTIVPRLVLGVLLFALALIQAAKGSFEMHKAKKWNPNQYISLFVKDGILYFFVNVLLNVISMLQNATTPSNLFMLFLNPALSALQCVMMPQFIISMRELYDSDSRGRLCGIDSGIGIRPRHTASQNVTVSTISFAEGALEQDKAAEGNGEDVEAIRAEAVDEVMHAVCERESSFEGVVSVSRGNKWRKDAILS